jgi:glutamate--cysteine ligase
MLTVLSEADAPLTTKAELVAYLETGSRPQAEWRIGTEHEKFGFTKADLRPLPYEGPHGIRAMLEGLQRFGWAPVREGEKVVALRQDGQSVTLEPGGQLELSGAAVETLHQTCDEVHDHLNQVRTVADEIDVAFMGVGFQPKWRREDMPMMPKGRYSIMREYMPKRGNLGLDMMFRTCTVQVNLDFASEADMVRKFRVGLALQPIATALFANSPFIEGQPNGFLSYRSHIWTDTDPDRTGILPFVFEDGMGFERYADYVLDVPMYFVYRDGAYIDASGQSFRDFLAGKLAALPGERPRLGDWENHLTTPFPEVRLKRFLEMRGADGGPWRRLCALPALWVGLLYDQAALDAAWDLVKGWTPEEHQALRAEVPRHAFKTVFRDRTVGDLAREVLAIARAGLKARSRTDRFGEDEAHFLDALLTIVESGRTPAEEHLEAFHGRWAGSVDPLFTEKAY